jgi:hypothetical protein
MLVIRKEAEIIDNEKKKNDEHAYNLMLYVLKNFSDMSIDDQLVIFNKMSFVRTLKNHFLSLREKVLADYSDNVNQESITITDLKADYHITNGMTEMHLMSIEQIQYHLSYYQDLFEKEKQKPHPNIDDLAKISLIVERLINRLSVLNNGTPIILFFRFQSKKQKLEVQQVKEKYQQQVLILKKEFEEKKLALENKNKDPAKEKSISKTDIEEKNNVTNPNIDELEHRAKLKDSGTRTFRSNTNRPNSKPNLKDERVQSDTSNSSETGTTSEDRSSEIFGGTEERRSKEAVF